MKKDYIPSKDADFNIFQSTLVMKVMANAMAWSIALVDITALQAQQMLWAAVWAIAQSKTNRTPSQTEAKNIQLAIYKSALRDFIQRLIIRNPLMNDADREQCGIMPHDTHHTPIPVPTSLPNVYALPENGHCMKIFFKQQPDAQGISRRGKPAGVQFCEFAYSLDVVPANAEACPERALVGRSPQIAAYTAQDAGKKLYYFARWVNPRGAAGNWTNMMEFMIP